MKKNYMLCMLLLAVSGLIQAQHNFSFTFKSPQELQLFLRYDTRFPPYVHAHRGGGYTGFPENCIATFDYTLKHIPAFMEIDPRVTKDGVIVLMHDATLDRTTTATGKVSDYTYAELQRFYLKDKSGKRTEYKIPTFEETLKWAKGKSVLIIDKKDTPIPRILEMIRKEKAEANVILMAYTPEDAKMILAYDPTLTLQVFAKNEEALNRLEQCNIPLGNVVAFVNHAYPEDHKVLDLLHQRNVKAIVGTSRNLDTDYAQGDKHVYDELLHKKVDIIEADSAIAAGQALIRFLKENPVLHKYLTFSAYSQSNGAYPKWKEGELEIHHINTGKGESVFSILPDGTTLLIDAGDIGNGNDPRNTQTIPDTTKEAGEWIAQYISWCLDFKEKKEVDYALLTHFHSDHMGSYSEKYPRTKQGGRYLLNGLTEVAECIPFRKMIDRGYPAYNYPHEISNPAFNNYRDFVSWNTGHGTMKAERFVPGSNKQFTLVNNPDKYRDLFEIRNIVANGEVWTGVGNETRHHFPETKDLKGAESVSENNCSAGIRISYGAFDYFNGGDITGSVYFNSPLWTDIETPVAKALGPVEVCEVNHHAWRDAMNEFFIASLRPQVFIMQVWNVSHFGLDVLARMQSKNLYKEDRDIFATNTPQISKEYISQSKNMKSLKGEQGHVVVKVHPGGKSYHIYMLDEYSRELYIKSIHGPYICR